MPKLSGPMLAPVSGGLPQQIVVLLHGYGSDGSDLIGLAPQFQPILPDALFVAPNAPEPVPGYPSGFQWFDVKMDGDRLASRLLGAAAARPILIEFLNDVWAQTGLGAAETILVGFSQGAMMALHVGLSLPEPLKGIIAFSGAFVPADGFAEDAFAKPPVCLVHGDLDTVVDPQLSAEAEIVLTKAGVPVHYHVSPGVGHGISPDGLAFATDFVSNVARAG